MNIDYYQKMAMRKNDGLAGIRMIRKINEQIIVEENLIKVGDVFEALQKMQEELGEITSPFNKWIFQEHNLDLDKVAEEIGDLMYYVAELCNALGWDLSEILKMNLDKIEGLYPDGFEPERSRGRKHEDI